MMWIHANVPDNTVGKPLSSSIIQLPYDCYRYTGNTQIHARFPLSSGCARTPNEGHPGTDDPPGPYWNIAQQDIGAKYRSFNQNVQAEGGEVSLAGRVPWRDGLLVRRICRGRCQRLLGPLDSVHRAPNYVSHARDDLNEAKKQPLDPPEYHRRALNGGFRLDPGAHCSAWSIGKFYCHEAALALLTSQLSQVKAAGPLTLRAPATKTDLSSSWGTQKPKWRASHSVPHEHLSFCSPWGMQALGITPDVAANASAAVLGCQTLAHTVSHTQQRRAGRMRILKPPLYRCGGAAASAFADACACWLKPKMSCWRESAAYATSAASLFLKLRTGLSHWLVPEWSRHAEVGCKAVGWMLPIRSGSFWSPGLGHRQGRLRRWGGGAGLKGIPSLFRRSHDRVATKSRLVLFDIYRGTAPGTQQLQQPRALLMKREPNLRVLVAYACLRCECPLLSHLPPHPPSWSQALQRLERAAETPQLIMSEIANFQIEEEMCLLDLEDADSLLEHVQDLVSQSMDDFPEDQVDDDAARQALPMELERDICGKISLIIRHYLTFHLRRNNKWDSKQVDEQTPRDIATFITQKCGPYSTAVSTRAALTMWYRNLRPNESLTEWRFDSAAKTWRGLPTRSRQVSQFMVGLEKTKAKSGEVSSSARALALEDIHRLHDHCMDPTLTVAQRRTGIVRYVAYLLAWLMLLRIDEVVKLRFENVDKVPGERRYLDVGLNTRKQNQTGLLHSWRLHANDEDPKVCPLRAFILLASLYGSNIRKTGPLFLHVTAQGAVMQSQPLVGCFVQRLNET
ncbi:hypothetical protein FB451DRAFT_1196148 [Mycena latifolia]|nr:hypothetical protein FB451DRAFT_1196148 [Mycena latifolia]